VCGPKSKNGVDGFDFVIVSVPKGERRKEKITFK
jgi:hypothetical protein